MYAVHKPRSVHISRQRAQSGDRSPTPREARVADRRVECLVSRHWDYCWAVFSRENEQSSRPLFDGDVLAKGLPAPVAQLRERIRRAHGVIFATPEYNFSIPGVLKNALDWASRGDDQPFALKPVAILSASPGPLGGARVQYDLRKVMLFMNALVMIKPEVFIGAAAGKFDADGRCTDESTRKFVADQMLSFQRWIGAVNRMSSQV